MPLGIKIVPLGYASLKARSVPIVKLSAKTAPLLLLDTDIDNYIKSVLDGLNGKAFKDDRYIYAILAEKEYSEEACIEVSIENVEGD